MPNINDQPPNFFAPTAQFNSASLSSSAASAGQLSGSAVTVMNNAGGTPGTYTTRTAAQMIADSNLVVGQQYWLLLVNGQGTGTLTLAGSTGVTISGTATVAPNVARLYLVTVNSASAITITNIMAFTATALAFAA